jgi:hypothetical protein
MPRRPRRIMPHVLLMPALELGNPVQQFILVETHDLPKRSRRFGSHRFHARAAFIVYLENTKYKTASMITLMVASRILPWINSLFRLVLFRLDWAMNEFTRNLSSRPMRKRHRFPDRKRLSQKSKRQAQKRVTPQSLQRVSFRTASEDLRSA